MPTHRCRTSCTLIATLLALAGLPTFAVAQPRVTPVAQPQFPPPARMPFPRAVQPGFSPTPLPGGVNNRPAAPNPVQVMPAINSFPGYPVWAFDRPAAFGPSQLQPPGSASRFVPARVLPAEMNPFQAPPLFQDPFTLNPLLRNPAAMNPFGVPGFSSSPPSVLALRERGEPEPTLVAWEPGSPAGLASGFPVYPGFTGLSPEPGDIPSVGAVVALADGSRFYRVIGPGRPLAGEVTTPARGSFPPPSGGTFFSPRLGLPARPETVNGFLPYIW